MATLHSCGGSMAEAVEPIGGAHLATKEDAEAVAKHFNDLAIAERRELFAIVTEVTPAVDVEAAIRQIRAEAYVFEDDEEEE